MSLFLGVGLLLVGAGCVSATHSVAPGDFSYGTQNPAAVWAESEISSYTMTYTSTCGDGAWVSMDPVTVQVNGGDVERVSGDIPGKLATVANLFGLIDAARAGGALNVTATYGEWGQPTDVVIAYTDAIDSQLCFDISSFEPA